jgi:hypothetical protein
MQRLACFGQENRPVAPFEQRYAQRVFQLPDLAADGAVRQVEFFGRAGEILVPRRRLEEADPAQPVHRSHAIGQVLSRNSDSINRFPYPFLRARMAPVVNAQPPASTTKTDDK